ncbi:hypothetical protein AFLA_001855 [Aspergillus flavus NRRL3357]|nr:hypothetical protein AFLA_001855 [Aspergillus flavus NRRL3357]
MPRDENLHLTKALLRHVLANFAKYYCGFVMGSIGSETLPCLNSGADLRSGRFIAIRLTLLSRQLIMLCCCLSVTLIGSSYTRLSSSARARRLFQGLRHSISAYLCV